MPDFFTPTMTIYEKRIACFTNLLENQKYTRWVDAEYVDVCIAEGKHPNGERRLAAAQKEYSELYKKCEAVMKPWR